MHSIMHISSRNVVSEIVIRLSSQIASKVWVEMPGDSKDSSLALYCKKERE
jgi:hypothetical protein